MTNATKPEKRRYKPRILKTRDGRLVFRNRKVCNKCGHFLSYTIKNGMRKADGRWEWLYERCWKCRKADQTSAQGRAKSVSSAISEAVAYGNVLTPDSYTPLGRDEAARVGQRTYWSDKPCDEHSNEAGRTERYASSGKCVEHKRRLNNSK